MNKDNVYYVYFYIRKDKNRIFYVGKGKGKRYLDKIGNRNEYFIRICNKTDVFPIIYRKNLTEKDAFELEKRMIQYLKNIGWAEANFHEGGSGGNTLKYASEEKKKQYRQKMSKSIQKICHTEDYRKKVSEGVRKAMNNGLKDKISKSMKKKWEDKEYREKQYKGMLGSNIWSPEKNESRSEKVRKEVYMYDDNWILIKKFKHKGEALEFLGLKGHMTLLKSIKNKTKYKGYYWSYELIEKSVETIETTSSDGRE